jgi:hypothetical protein
MADNPQNFVQDQIDKVNTTLKNSLNWVNDNVTALPGLGGTSPGLSKQGYSSDGTPPDTPIKQTPTGQLTTKYFEE